MTSFTVSTRQREAFLDITGHVSERVAASAIAEGACLVYCPHTTAGLTINECADPAVMKDMKAALKDLVPEDIRWHHMEGNSPAHVKASLIGSSVVLPVSKGAPVLGRWQGVFLCEFDGPRMREVWVQVYS